MMLTLTGLKAYVLHCQHRTIELWDENPCQLCEGYVKDFHVFMVYAGSSEMKKANEKMRIGFQILGS